MIVILFFLQMKLNLILKAQHLLLSCETMSLSGRMKLQRRKLCNKHSPNTWSSRANKHKGNARSCPKQTQHDWYIRTRRNWKGRCNMSPRMVPVVNDLGTQEICSILGIQRSLGKKVIRGVN